MAAIAVFDLDKVLLGGNAATLFLRGRLRQAPRRVVPLLLAAPLLLPAAAAPTLRPMAARALTRVTGASSADDVADAYRTAVARAPQAAVADAIACMRAHEEAGEQVVVATAAEETLARGYLAAIGLGRFDVVGSTGWPRPVRVHGTTKVTMLTGRGYPPPWTAVYSDSSSDLPLFAGATRPVLVNASPRAAAEVARVLGAAPETRTWR